VLLFSVNPTKKIPFAVEPRQKLRAKNFEKVEFMNDPEIAQTHCN
jgi:hypothetical protein